MNKFILSTLLGGATAVVYNAVDDPRCHDDPSRPVLEPTPGPTPYPDPPTNDRTVTQMTDAPTKEPPPEVPCTGEVTGFKILDLDTGATSVLADKDVLKLSAMPDKFTIQAITSGSLASVDFYFNDAIIGTDDTAPFTFTVDNWKELNTEGTFLISAMGPTDTPGLKCEYEITTIYDNPHVCQGLIQQFALFDTVTQAIVPGYPLLHDNEVIQKSQLANPEHLTIVAIDNGRRKGDVIFGYGTNGNYHTSAHAIPSISGRDANGNALTWDILNQQEFITISAKSSNMMDIPESTVCEITIQIEHTWACPYKVSGFALVYGGTHTPVPGFENILGYKAVDLNDIVAPNGLTLAAHSSHSGVEFYVNGNYIRTENYHPYAINGDNSGGMHEFQTFRDVGQYVIEAQHKNEANDGSTRCKLTLTIQRDSTITTIDDPTFCAPEAVVPEQVGNHMFESTPVAVQTRVDDVTVSMKTKQTILTSGSLDWVTTVFVADNGYEVCDKIDNMAYNQESAHTYDIKCFDGFAYADIYASSSTFSDTEATADVTMLPAGCKSQNPSKVVKYTIVFSCNCQTTPDIPDEFIGGPTPKSDTCTGVTAYSWGDPHVVPFHGKRSDGWNCQVEGEFVLSQAELIGYPYNFELHSRFTKFGQQLPWTFNSGVVAAQDVKVQISMGVIGENTGKPNMMDNVPIHFYVDDVPRYFHEGTGDLRVKIRVDGFHVYVTFVETGIQVHVQVRPFQSDPHSGILRNYPGQTIPGSFTTYVCFPSDNANIGLSKGLLGTQTPDMTDNFMLPDGTQVSKPSGGSARNAYCRDNWCIKNSANTLFSFEANKDFSMYNGCGTRRALEIADMPRQLNTNFDCAGCCASMDGDANTFCLDECDANGEVGCNFALETIAQAEQTQRDSDSGTQPDDARCCSVDYKTCLAGCDCQTSYLCDAMCSAPYMLPGGETPRQNCAGLGQSATSFSDGCCDPLVVDGTGNCVVGRRRLAHDHSDFTFERKGVDMNNRNIVPLHTEL